VEHVWHARGVSPQDRAAGCALSAIGRDPATIEKSVLLSALLPLGEVRQRIMDYVAVGVTHLIFSVPRLLTVSSSAALLRRLSPHFARGVMTRALLSHRRSRAPRETFFPTSTCLCLLFYHAAFASPLLTAQSRGRHPLARKLLHSQLLHLARQRPPKQESSRATLPLDAA